MVKWARALQIAIPSAMVATMVAVPVGIHYGVDEKILYVPQDNIVVDSTTGAGELTIPLNDKVLNDQVLVSVINKSHENLVTLFLDGQEPYSNENSLVYPVVDGNVHVNFSFSQFQGDDIDAVFDLEVDYLTKHNHTKRKFARNMTLSTNYHHDSAVQHVHIVDINDLHGAAPGYGDDSFKSTSPKNPGVVRLMDKISDILVDNPGSIFLSAGDNNSGEAFSSSTHAESLFPILSSMGVSYSAVGNHAFEWGYDDLTTDKYDQLGRTQKTLGHYLVTANILEHPFYQDHFWMYNPRVDGYDEIKAETDYKIWKNQQVNWADPYKLVNLDGHLVCLVGLTTQKAMSDGNQAIVKNTSIIDYGASIYYATKYCYDNVGPEWYDAIETFVMLTHIESDPVVSSDNDALSVAANAQVYDPRYHDDADFSEHDDPTNKVSLVISGHSHKEVDREISNTYTGKIVKVGQASTAGRAFLDSDFIFDNTKPVGQRWMGLEVEVKKVQPFWNNVEKEQPDPSKWDEDQKARAFAGAQNEFNNLMTSPRNEMVEKVVKEYTDQRKIVLETLSQKLSYSTTGHAYSPLGPGKDIGHEYIMPEHVIEPAGSWVSIGSMVGFSFLFQDEILSPTSSITYPSISFIAEDSINGSISPNSDVTLENMYNMQTHDNTTYFGFLSVWQLAAIIDYALSGGTLINREDPKSTYFNYENNRNYVTYPSSYTEYEHDRDLQYNWHAYDKGDNLNVPLADDGAFDSSSCCYPCGPMQWYGFKFNVNKITNDDEQHGVGRPYKLNYVPKKSGHKYDILEQKYYPDIQIYDPLAPNTDPSDGLYDPGKWLDAQDWLVEKEDSLHGLIPCITNSFLYDGGNKQFGMVAKYFEHNKNEYGKAFAPTLFSTLIRDLMIEYAKKTDDILFADIFKFDGSFDVTPELITIN